MKGRIIKEAKYISSVFPVGTEFEVLPAPEAERWIAERGDMAPSVRDEISHGGVLGVLAGLARLIDRDMWEVVP